MEKLTRHNHLLVRYLAVALTLGFHILIVYLTTLNNQRAIIRNREIPILVLSTGSSVLNSHSSRLTAVRSSYKQFFSNSQKFLSRQNSSKNVKSTSQIYHENLIGSIDVSDPFANPSIAEVGSIVEKVQSVVPISAPNIIRRLLEADARDMNPMSCKQASVSFAMTVHYDGSVTDIRFTAGSVELELGARLAHALEGKMVFARSVDGSTRRTIVGPILLNLVEQPGEVQSANTGQDQCRG